MQNLNTPTNDQAERKGNKNIAFGTILGVVGFVLTVLSALLFTPWVIKEISKSTYGLYTLSSSLISIFLLDFGLGDATNTFLSKLRAKNDKDSINKFIASIYKLYLLMDLLILAGFAIGFFLIDPLYSGLTADEKESLKIVFLISAGFSVASFPASVYNGVLSAYEEFIFIKIVNIIDRVLYIVFTILALKFQWGLVGLVFANCLASFLCTITKVVFAHGKEKIPFVWRAKFSRQETKEVISFSFWSFVISIAARLIFNIMPSILGIVSDSTNIAVFGIVVSLEGNIYNFGTIMSGFFIAKITRISQNATSETEKVEKMQNLGVKIGKIIYAFLLLVVIGFIATGKDFILLWMDGDTTYIPAYWGTSLIILGLLIIVPEAVFQLSMYVEKKIQPLAIVYLLKGLINVALAFPLAFYYGAFGACVAVAVARFFEVLALNYCYHHFLKINIWQFAAKTFLMPTIPGLIVFCIGLLLHFFLPLPLLYKFIVEVVAMVLSYLPLAYYVSFGSDERKGIKSFFSMKNKAKNR